MTLLSKMLMAAAGRPTEILPESIDLDGSNDYFKRTGDFTGNTDSKTFTFSIFIYPNGPFGMVYRTIDGTVQVDVTWNNAGYIQVEAENTGGTTVLNVKTANGSIPTNTFSHVLVSIDLTDTGKRSIYLNDQSVTPTWTTYTNSAIAFTGATHNIGSDHGGGSKVEGRLTHFYLDYTYRDLSIEANRRLFITEDLKPAQAAPLIALNPIAYFQMIDPDTAHINSGTGGDMVKNGVIALSERGPNQDNCASSAIDSSTDYLSKTAFVTDGKIFTCSFTAKPDTNSSEIIKVGSLDIDFSSGILRIISSGVLDLQSTSVVAYAGRNISVQIAVDMSNSYVVIVDGEQVTMTQTTYVNNNLGLNGVVDIGKYVNGALGEVWFDDDIQALSIFIDSDTNKPIPVRQVIEDIGQPLIAMPIRADDPGENLGSGGNFTLSGGPLVGARGDSEFWARSAKSGTTNITTTYSRYLHNSSLIADSPDFSGVLFVYPHLAKISDTVLLELNGTKTVTILVSNTDHFTVEFDGQKAQDSLDVQGSQWSEVFFWYSSTDSIIHLLVNTVEHISSATTGVNLNTSTATILSAPSKHDSPSSVGFTYFTTNYIDFSDENNRLLFVDALGYPTDLQKKIDDGEVPEPLIYMPFDDTSDLGKNNGTGGDFTVNGTVTAGSDVDPNA